MDIIIDHGQKIYIAEPDEIDEIIEKIIAREKKRLHRSGINCRIYRESGEFCRKYASEGLHFGYYFWDNDEENGWFEFIAMYKKELGYQRVQFENSKCLSCKSGWRIANPSYLGIYPNYDFDISECEYPLLDCPKCGGKLSRDAIWIGSELDPDDHWNEAV